MKVLRAGPLAALLVAGCWTIPGEYEGPIHERFQVPEKASAECVSAAKRASRWCPGIDKDVWADQLYGTSCNEARWDYARYCQ
ncbi:MAG: hypothetical protein ACREVS_05685 [Burkholderiales bacterium]